MSALRRIIAVCLVAIAVVFPANALAWPGEGLWNDVKEGVGDILDFGGGVLEVGWEGIYGAGCGVKNLVTWDGDACSTSVADSGDSFRSLIRDVDDCAAVFEPTGIAGLGTGETVNTDDTSFGLTPAEIDAAISTATTEGPALNSAMAAYLKSPGGRAAIERNPVWQRVARGLPVIKYATIALGIAQYCGSTLDFLVFGLPYLGTGQEVWREEDGVWMHCTLTCVPDPDLNYPGCEPVFVGGGDLGPVELVCRPGTGDPGPPPTADESLRRLVCPPVISSSGSNFDFDAYCADRMRDAAAECRAGTSRLTAATCSQLTGSTQVGTTNGAGGGGPTSVALDATSVPGGTIEGSCAAMIRDIARRSTITPYSSSAVAACVGTSDGACQVLRAKAAAGYAVFPLAGDIQRRCFG